LSLIEVGAIEFPSFYEVFLSSIRVTEDEASEVNCIYVVEREWR